MAATTWGNMTLSTTADLAKLNPNYTDWGVATIADKITLAKNHIARDVRAHLAEYKGRVPTLQEGDDGATNADSSFVAAGAEFQKKGVNSGHFLWIKDGADKGIYGITSVTNDTTLVLETSPVLVADSLNYFIEPDVLDWIKNPTDLSPASHRLALYYAASEVIVKKDDYFDNIAKNFLSEYEKDINKTIQFLKLDVSGDGIIDDAERRSGISNGRLIR